MKRSAVVLASALFFLLTVVAGAYAVEITLEPDYAAALAVLP